MILAGNRLPPPPPPPWLPQACVSPEDFCIFLHFLSRKSKNAFIQVIITLPSTIHRRIPVNFAFCNILFLIGLTRTETAILSHCSTDNAQVNRAMFTYVPSALTLENSTFCAQRVYIFGMVLITKSDYLCIINLSVFITEEECVLLRGHGSDRQSPASHRGSSSRSQVSPCEICGGDKAVMGQVFLRVIRFPLSLIPTMLHTQHYLRVALSRRILE